MASTSNLRLRRSEAQLHALAGVEREIRINDPNGRRKYLQDFSQAFRSYESVIDRQQLNQSVRGADTILIGDYHALPSAQRFAAILLEELANDRQWDASFAKSQDKLGTLADEALAEHLNRKTKPLDIDKL